MEPINAVIDPASPPSVANPSLHHQRKISYGLQLQPVIRRLPTLHIKAKALDMAELQSPWLCAALFDFEAWNLCCASY